MGAGLLALRSRYNPGEPRYNLLNNMKPLTYQELLDILKQLSPEQLEEKVKVFDHSCRKVCHVQDVGDMIDNAAKQISTWLVVDFDPESGWLA